MNAATLTSDTPGRLLRAIAVDVARATLTAPQFAGKGIDPDRFATANRSALLLVLARTPSLRSELNDKYRHSPHVAHPLLTALLSADPTASADAAHTLGTDHAALAPPPAPPGESSAPASTAAAPTPTDPTPGAARRATADKRRAQRMAAKLDDVRKARDVARSQTEWATRERDRAASERDSALADLSEALSVVEGLRATLAAERARAAALGTDIPHAARTLAAALRPATPIDIREIDRQDTLSPTASAALSPQGDTAVLTALEAAALPVEALLTALDAIVNPPEPARPVFTHAREISVTPLGGGTEIGGSCMLVEVGDVRILVDAGTRPKITSNDIGPPDIARVFEGDLDAIVITHAHNDHAGYVPVLTARYPWVEVFCSADTAALLPTMWNDSVEVFKRTGHERAKYGDPAAEPVYTNTEALAAQQRIQELAFGRTVEVADGVTIELFPAGHILGAAGVVVTAGESRVTITGDVSTLAQASVPGLVVPAAARRSDLLVIESTYCRAGGSARVSEVENFISKVNEVVSGGGRVLVPAFALGRAQEVVLTLRNHLPDVRVLVDGMAKEISRIYESQTADTDNPLKIYGDQVKAVPAGAFARRQENAALRRGVVVTTSGMLSAGPAVQWAQWILPEERSALFVSGHQDEESPGFALLRLAAGQSTFNLEGRDVEVRASVADFKLSAHADRDGLESIIAAISPVATMLVHGNYGEQQRFGEHLHRSGFTVARTERWSSA